MNMLRSIREKKGLTLSQLAARTSISARALADYEEGRQSLPLSHAKVLARALWVQIEDLMPPAGSVQRSAQSTIAGGGIDTSIAATSPPSPTRLFQEPDVRNPRAPARQEEHHSHRPTGGQSQTERSSAEGGGGPKSPDAHAARTKPVPPPGPISSGQLQELSRLAANLEISKEQLEERIGKGLSALTRPDAKDWIKRLRAMLEEIAPSRKTQFGRWPQAEDREAAYLSEQQTAQTTFLFKLFDGEQFTGTISDFTPYTITVKLAGSGDDMVLRKLAIAYYRRAHADQLPTSEDQPATKTTRSRATKPAKSHLAAESTPAHSHQPLETGIASDRVGEPKTPEADKMDEDRGV